MRLTLASPYFVPLRDMQESKHAEELVEILYIKPYANIANKGSDQGAQNPIFSGRGQEDRPFGTFARGAAVIG
jgi:hypothetical protein